MHRTRLKMVIAQQMSTKQAENHLQFRAQTTGSTSPLLHHCTEVSQIFCQSEEQQLYHSALHHLQSPDCLKAEFTAIYRHFPTRLDSTSSLEAVGKTIYYHSFCVSLTK